MGPNSSSGAVCLVRRLWNFFVVPFTQSLMESRRRDLPVPGAPTRRGFSWQMRAVRTKSISPSRSMRASDISFRAAANLAWMAVVTAVSL